MTGMFANRNIDMTQGQWILVQGHKSGQGFTALLMEDGKTFISSEVMEIEEICVFARECQDLLEMPIDRVIIPIAEVAAQANRSIGCKRLIKRAGV